MSARIARHTVNDDPVCWSWDLPDRNEDWHDDYAALYAWGDGCAVCGAPGVLVCDHSHYTGFIRGWLCRSCNVREGRHDHPDLEKYRACNPASILGLSVTYVNIFGETPMYERSAPVIGDDPCLTALEGLAS